MQAFIDLSSKVNAIYLDIAKEFSLKIQNTGSDAQKINSSKLDTFSMVEAFFSIEDNEKRSHFFEESFILTDISIYIVLKMLFFTLNNVKIDFVS